MITRIDHITIGVADLPEKKQKMYNYQRNSKIFVKPL